MILIDDFEPLYLQHITFKIQLTEENTYAEKYTLKKLASSVSSLTILIINVHRSNSFYF